MNRIVLIGNGFDLAHGLPTKYENFINLGETSKFFCRKSYIYIRGLPLFYQNYFRQ